jgi:Flp pilus assembly protein TadD
LWNEILARRVAEGNLYTLDNLNMGFVRPASSDDWTLAYYQATLYVRYLAETYGDDVPGKMLAAYADNLSTRQALARCCGVEQEQIETGYRRFVETIVASFVARQAPPSKSLVELLRTAEENSDDADAAASLALAYLQRSDAKRAGEWADAARANEPRHPIACYVSARLLAADGKEEEARTLLRESIDKAAPNEEALALLATLEARAGNSDEAASLYTLGMETFVRSDRWLAALARHYLDTNQNDQLATTLVAVCERSPDDLFSRKKLAQLASQRGDHEQAARWAMQAIYIDVSDAEVHALLGKALAAGGKKDRAIQEYETAIVLDRRNTDWQVALAELYLDAGRKDDARRIVESLRAADPDSEEVQRLLERLNP